MDFKYKFGLLVTVVTAGATAAMVIWPYNFSAELVLCASIFFGIVVVGWMIIDAISPTRPRVRIIAYVITSLASGAYLMVSGIYFFGFLSNTYPLSQKLINDQVTTISTQSNEISALKGQLEKTTASLTDATKVLADPLSVARPAYQLDTSLKLHFNRQGDAKELESHNISWKEVDVTESTEVAPGHDNEPTQVGGVVAPTCGLGNIACLGTTSIPDTIPLANCPKYTCPASGPSYRVSEARIIIIAFLRPIAITDLKLDSFDDTLPRHRIMNMDSHSAVLWFDDTPAGVTLSISALQAAN